MKNIELYLNAAAELFNKNNGTRVTRKDIVIEMGPAFIDRMGILAANHAKPTTGEGHACGVLGAALGEYIARGGDRIVMEKENNQCFYSPGVVGNITINDEELIDASEDLSRTEIEKQAELLWSATEKRRAAAFLSICRGLEKCMPIFKFERDHAQPLMNKENPGQHHPDNFQILLDRENNKKNVDSWKRYNFAEQKAQLQFLLNYSAGDQELFDLLMRELEAVF